MFAHYSYNILYTDGTDDLGKTSMFSVSDTITDRQHELLLWSMGLNQYTGDQNRPE